MKAYANIETQTEMDVLPSIINLPIVEVVVDPEQPAPEIIPSGPTLNPTWEQLKLVGYRRLTSEDVVTEGRVATEWHFDDVDGETASKRLVASITVEEDAAQLAAAEVIRQSLKSAALRAAENAFLSLCDQLTGSSTHEKLGFAQLNSTIDGMPDQSVAAVLAIRLLAINAEAVREGGLQWWDDCAWHPEEIG